MDEAEAAEAALAAAHTADVGQEDLRRIADDHVLDRATPVDQHADLAMQLGALHRELSRQLGRHDLGRRDAPAVQALERLDLARLETGEVSCDFFLHALGTLPDGS